MSWTIESYPKENLHTQSYFRLAKSVCRLPVPAETLYSFILLNVRDISGHQGGSDHVILLPPSLSSALGLLWFDKELRVCLTEGGAVLQTHLQDEACTSPVITQNLECCEGGGHVYLCFGT